MNVKQIVEIDADELAEILRKNPKMELAFTNDHAAHFSEPACDYETTLAAVNALLRRGAAQCEELETYRAAFAELAKNDSLDVYEYDVRGWRVSALYGEDEAAAYNLLRLLQAGVAAHREAPSTPSAPVEAKMVEVDREYLAKLERVGELLQGLGVLANGGYIGFTTDESGATADVTGITRALWDARDAWHTHHAPAPAKTPEQEAINWMRSVIANEPVPKYRYDEARAILSRYDAAQSTDGGEVG